jgi:beta-glucosidase
VRDEESSLPRPPRELKGFTKVFLRAGEKKRVALTLPAGAFSFYDPARRGWVLEAGDFKVAVGASSRDTRLEGRIRFARTSLVR